MYSLPQPKGKGKIREKSEAIVLVGVLGSGNISQNEKVLFYSRSQIQSVLFCFVFIHSHEDGTVKFWDVSSLSYTLLYTISTSHLFENDFDGGPPPEDDEEDWPPFKKVGAFDPYADDPRFVIQKLLFCPVTKTLIVGGSGGQVIWYTLQDDDSTAVEVSS